MIEPLNKYLVVKVEDDAEKTNGGLYVPQGSKVTATDILRKGTIISIGSRVEDKVEVGDIVYYNRHAITEIPGDKTQIFVRIEDLYGVIKN